MRQYGRWLLVAGAAVLALSIVTVGDRHTGEWLLGVRRPASAGIQPGAYRGESRRHGRIGRSHDGSAHRLTRGTDRHPGRARNRAAAARRRRKERCIARVGTEPDRAHDLVQDDVVDPWVAEEPVVLCLREGRAEAPEGVSEDVACDNLLVARHSIGRRPTLQDDDVSARCGVRGDRGLSAAANAAREREREDAWRIELASIVPTSSIPTVRGSVRDAPRRPSALTRDALTHCRGTNGRGQLAIPISSEREPRLLSWRVSMASHPRSIWSDVAPRCRRGRTRRTLLRARAHVLPEHRACSTTSPSPRP